jgi:uncharacterized protein (DUF1015 family)
VTKSDSPGGNHQRLRVLLTYVPILPSSQVPAECSPQGLVLAPFRGIRYAEDRVSGLAEVTSPPYDVIAADIENQLIASDPHNIVRIILPRHPAGQPGSPYEDAAADLTAWMSHGILLPDPEPALYVYEQVSVDAGGRPEPGGVLQRGLIGAVNLPPPSAGIIQPHENVSPFPAVRGGERGSHGASRSSRVEPGTANGGPHAGRAPAPAVGDHG